MLERTQIEEIIRLRCEGKSYQRIANELSVSKPTVIKYILENQNLIQNCDAIRREATISELKSGFAKRMEINDEIYAKISAELLARPIDKENFSSLYSILLKVDAQISAAEKMKLSQESDYPSFTIPKF